jgi:EAL domain-containing protein (putative c-di-GMP-specific phosphodiesterase class I)
MRTGDVVGAEVLVRWQHPERGLLTPAAFLPLIADHPLALQLGHWILHAALTQFEAWKAAGLHLPVSVNIDAMQLEQPDFVDQIQRLLALHPTVLAGDLELEVLETSALNDMTQATRVVSACRALGVGFALDDFGTGYSSLTYLKRLPASVLKMDQSFVRDMMDDADDLAILEGVLGLARSFQRLAIAEGVETVEQGEILLCLGCELAQGYAIARPMPAGDIPAWLAQWLPPAAWRNRTPLNRPEMTTLIAVVEHRAWLKQVAHFLAGTTEAAPLTPSLPRHVGAPALNLADIQHMVQELVQQKRDGQPLATHRLQELHQLRDVLLKDFMAQASGPSSLQGAPSEWY